MKVILKSGSYKKTIKASQHSVGENFIAGIYSASFLVSDFFTGTSHTAGTDDGYFLKDEIKTAGSCSFTEIWSSLDETIGYATGSLVIRSVNRSLFKNQNKRLLMSITNIKSEYRHSDVVRFRIFSEDIDRDIKYSKLPLETQSQIFTSLYYRIKDAESGKVIIPFDDSSSNGTLCSCDSDGMYFDLYMSSLFKGKLYTIDLLVKDRGIDQIFTDIAAKFRIV